MGDGAGEGEEGGSRLFIAITVIIPAVVQGVPDKIQFSRLSVFAICPPPPSLTPKNLISCRKYTANLI